MTVLFVSVKVCFNKKSNITRNITILDEKMSKTVIFREKSRVDPGIDAQIHYLKFQNK